MKKTGPFSFLHDFDVELHDLGLKQIFFGHSYCIIACLNENLEL